MIRRLAEVIELAFRHVIVYPLFRLLFRNPQSELPIDLQSVHKILILRYDRIGDMIVTTPIFRLLKKENPSLNIGVFTSRGNAEIIRNNRYVDDIYLLQNNWIALLREILRARRKHYDVVLNFIFNRTTSAGILANLIAPRGFKVGQGAKKYRFYFNRLIKLERSEQHMVEVLSDYVGMVFGLPMRKDELAFEINIDELTKESVDRFLKSNLLSRKNSVGSSAQSYCVVNISSTDEVRKISHFQVVALIEAILKKTEWSVVINCVPVDRSAARRDVNEIGSKRVILYPSEGESTLSALASLIEGAVCVFTPDTSIIHFASAMKTPVLGFFSPQQKAHEWVPYNVPHRSVIAPEGSPVSAIPVQEIRSEVDAFLSQLKKDTRVAS